MSTGPSPGAGSARSRPGGGSHPECSGVRGTWSILRPRDVSGLSWPWSATGVGSPDFVRRKWGSGFPLGFGVGASPLPLLLFPWPAGGIFGGSRCRRSTWSCLGAVDARSLCNGRIPWRAGGIPGGVRCTVDSGFGLGSGCRGNLRRVPTPWPRRSIPGNSAGYSPSALGACSFPSHTRAGLPAFLPRSAGLYSSWHWVWPVPFSPVFSSASVLAPSRACEP